MGQLCWLSNPTSGEAKSLHARQSPSEPWVEYSQLPQALQVPDYRIPGGSKGWATFLALRNAGWELLPSSH